MNSQVIVEDSLVRTELITNRNEYFVRKKIKSPRLLRISLDFLAKFLCDREIRVLKRLESINGVPEFIEQDSSTSFIMSYIEGTPLKYADNLSRSYYNRLENILDQAHRRGVADLDFGNAKDILIQKNGEPAVLDWTCSLVYNPSHGLRARIVKPFFDYVCRLNKKYLLRSMSRKLPHEITPDEVNEGYNLGIIERVGSFYKRVRQFFKYSITKAEILQIKN